jgi:hypothetical protein
MSGPRTNPPRRRRPIVVILIAFVVILLLIEGAIVVGVFVSPDTGDRLREVVGKVEDTWNGTESEPGLRTRTAERISEGYHEWISPLWSDPETPDAEPEFTECVECHAGYAKQRRFSSVYMNHPLHAQIGVACETCHPQNVHPSPPRPTEDTCAECHVEVEQREKCGTCHPPGSLPHFYLLGAPRKAVVQCDVCHPSDTFEATATEPLVTGDFTGEDTEACRRCHGETTCATCHEPGHPSGWMNDHPAGAADLGPAPCYQCHTSLWCGSRCHAVTDANPFVPQSLPDAGVDPS